MKSGPPRTVFFICLLAGLVGFSTRTQAKMICTFGISNINFGNIDLTANTVFDTTGTLTVNCSGGNNGDRVRICPNIETGSGGTSGGNPRFMLNGATQLLYNLYQDSAHTTVWGSFLWGNPQTAPTIDLTLGAGGSGGTSVTIFARVFASQQTLAPGTFTSAFSGSNTRLVYATTNNTCASLGTQNETSAPFTVSATYLPTCAISAANLNFGTAGVLASNVDGSSNLTVTCSATTGYNIGLSAGAGAGATVASRKMTSAGATINYSLYTTGGRTTVWGNTVGADTVSGTGSGLGQPLTVFGRVPPQTTPAPGTYTDTIVATVTY
ncbi:MAG TPA: spore coat protein U domain-containing protein [Pseudolabrys sp.]|nr:spore coat protein U domain-containing protein [Pseudolabrys sp.]